jgi:hypothetical protein
VRHAAAAALLVLALATAAGAQTRVPEFGPITGGAPTADDDVPEAADFSNLTAGTGLAHSPTGTIGLDYSFTEAGNPALTAGQCVFSSARRGIICEGATADTIEVGIQFPDPTGSDNLIAVPAGNYTVVGDTLAQTLTNKTLTTPTIGSFTNATHDHTNAAGGGTLGADTVGTTQIATDGVDAAELKSTAIQNGDIEAGDLPNWALGTGQRRFSYLMPVNTTMLGIGMPVPTVSGTGAQAGTARSIIEWTSAASTGSKAGYDATTMATRQAFRPKMVAYIKTENAADMTNRTIWVGLSSASLTGVNPNDTDLDTSTFHFGVVAFRSTDSSAWRCCTGDGSDGTCTDIPSSTAAVNTEYVITIDWSVNAEVTCKVTQVGGSTWTLTKTTNISTGTNDLSVVSVITTANNTARKHYMAGLSLEQN